MVKLLVIDEKLKQSLDKLKTESDNAQAPYNSGRILTFQLPCEGAAKRLFLFQDSILYELQNASLGDSTSWFMDDEVVQDGSFLVATPFQV